MKKWKFVNIVNDGQPLSINGVNPWDYEWLSQDKEPIEVPHPSYPNQKHKMWVYTINTGKKTLLLQLVNTRIVSGDFTFLHLRVISEI